MYVCVAVFTVYTGKGKSFGSSCSLQLTVKARVEFEYREAAACTCFAGLVEAKLCLGMTGVANPNLSEELPSWLSIPLHFFFFFLAELCSRAACAAQVRHLFIHQADSKRPLLGLTVALTCGSGLYRPR